MWLNVDGGKRAVLSGADLNCADLRNADLCDANLYGAILRFAVLSGANLHGANLRGADLDYATWPLRHGTLGVHIDDRLAIQLLYRLLYNVNYSKNVSKAVKDFLLTDDLVELANKFHQVGECGLIDIKGDNNDNT